METCVVDDTAAAVAVKVALVKPAPMVIEFGTVTVALDDISAITVLDCAGLPRPNVHVLEPGVWMEIGEHTRVGVDDAAIVIVAVRVAVPAWAVMVELPEALALAEALNPMDDWPDEIETETGTVTCGLLLASNTVTPPDPAGPLRVTVQLLVAPGATDAGEHTTDDKIPAG